MSGITAGECAVLVIDMQQGLVTGAYNEAKIVAAINDVVERARDAGCPVIYVQHCHQHYKPLMKGEAGWKIHPGMNFHNSDEVVEKTASDAFYKTSLAKKLTVLGIQQLVITGMQSEYCVDATCRSALSHDFNVLLVADGHTTGNGGMPAEDIIRHHNEILPNLAHPSATLLSVNSGELLFA